MDNNIGLFLSKRAMLNPELEAVIDYASGRRFSFAALNARANQVAHAMLGRGVAKGDRVALQGNMDPAVLYASPAAIRAEVARILDDFGDHPGHIFNLGHGITPEVDPEHAKVFIEAVVELGERK